MNKADDLQLQVLSKACFSRDLLKNLVSRDKRNFEGDVIKLIALNRPAFDFLGIEAQGTYDAHKNFALQLTSSQYSGIVPLRSVEHGKRSGCLRITGRYQEAIDDVLPLLENEHFTPQFNDALPLDIDVPVKPPQYIQCLKYLNMYQAAERSNWRKFSSQRLIQNSPHHTDWTKYALRSFNPCNALNFPNQTNLLTTHHPEWQALQFVLDLAINEIQSIRTPHTVRMQYASTIEQLARSYDKKALYRVNHIPIHAADPHNIKTLKNLANTILDETSKAQYAWRLDHALFFERYTQYVFRQLGHRLGARTINNPHFRFSGSRPTWALNYLEPDLVMLRHDEQIIVDAKYKSHMYNWDRKSDNLRNVFREDLHQVLAYSAFSSMSQKRMFLVYPYREFKYYSMRIHSRLNDCTNQVFLLGMPIAKDKIQTILDALFQLIS